MIKPCSTFWSVPRCLVAATALALPLTAQLVSPQRAIAECPDGGYPQPLCEGRPDLRVCDESSCPPPEPTYATGSLTPKYMIAGLIYAPPGSKDCKTPGSVSYSSSSTLGTTLTVGDSFRESHRNSITVSVSGGVASGSAGVSFGADDGRTNTSSVDVRTTTGISMEGPSVCTDGIDHDWDTFRIVFAPHFDVVMSNGSVTMTPVMDQRTRVEKVTVGQLKGTSPMSNGMQQAAADYGLDSSDFSEILNLDPWAFDSQAGVDEQRFRYTGYTLVYDNHDDPTGRPGTEGTEVSNDMTSTMSQEVSHSYTVGLTLEGSASYLGLVKASLKNENSWTWGSTSTTAGSVANRTSAVLKVGVPSLDYTGPIMMEVYYDELYRSFVCVPTR